MRHLHTDKEAVVNAVSGTDAFKIWEKYVSRVELSLPLVPSELATRMEALDERWQRTRADGAVCSSAS